MVTGVSAIRWFTQGRSGRVSVGCHDDVRPASIPGKPVFSSHLSAVKLQYIDSHCHSALLITRFELYTVQRVVIAFVLLWRPIQNGLDRAIVNCLVAVVSIVF